MSMDRWVDKDLLLLYNGILFSHKHEWNNAICSNMHGPRDYHTKWILSDRRRQISYDITYIWNLKNDTDELFYKIEIEVTDVESKLTVINAWGEKEDGAKLDLDWHIYTLLYIK